MADATRTGDLEVRRSRAPLVLWLVAAAALVAVAAWYVTHPDPLPVSDRTADASTPVGEPVYVGVFAPTQESDRTIQVDEVAVRAEDDDLPVTIAALVCKGGSVGITSEPARFCDALVDADGASLGPGDVLVLEIQGDAPGVVRIDRVEVTYRDGWQWGTDEVGAAVLARFLSREAAQT